MANGLLGGVVMEKQEKRRWLVAAALSLAVLGASLYNGAQQSLPRAGDVKAPPEEATVYVSGAVNHPGIVRLESGKRLADALDAAGGAAPGADLGKLNLAQPLKDGQQIAVPLLARTGGGVQVSAASADGLININSADKTQLDKLPGIGPAMAEKIIEYRETHGAYQKPEDLKKVKGIGEAKFNKLKDKITL